MSSRQMLMQASRLACEPVRPLTREEEERTKPRGQKEYEEEQKRIKREKDVRTNRHLLS